MSAVSSPRGRRLLIPVLLAALVYAASWVGFALGWPWVQTVDTAALTFFHRIGTAHPGWVRIWDVVCTVGGPGTFRVLGVPVIVVALLRHRPRTAIFVLMTVETSGLVTTGLKWLAGRHRPVTALVHEAGSSFPSGHALGVAAAVLALAAVCRPRLGPRARTATLVAGGVLIVVIGVGRVVLNVHHPTDVLAGWAGGYLWFTVWLLVCPPGPAPLPRFRSAGDTPPEPGTGSGNSRYRSAAGLRRRSRPPSDRPGR